MSDCGQRIKLFRPYPCVSASACTPISRLEPSTDRPATQRVALKLVVDIGKWHTIRWRFAERPQRIARLKRWTDTEKDTDLNIVSVPCCVTQHWLTKQNVNANTCIIGIRWTAPIDAFVAFARMLNVQVGCCDVAFFGDDRDASAIRIEVYFLRKERESCLQVLQSHSTIYRILQMASKSVAVGSTVGMTLLKCLTNRKVIQSVRINAHLSHGIVKKMI